MVGRVAVGHRPAMHTVRSWLFAVSVGITLLACDGGGGGAQDGGGRDSGVDPSTLVPICHNLCETLDSQVCISSVSECRDDCPNQAANVVTMGCVDAYARYSGCVFGASADEVCPGMSISAGACGTALQELGDCLFR